MALRLRLKLRQAAQGRISTGLSWLRPHRYYVVTQILSKLDRRPPSWLRHGGRNGILPNALWPLQIYEKSGRKEDEDPEILDENKLVSCQEQRCGVHPTQFPDCKFSHQGPTEGVLFSGPSSTQEVTAYVLTGSHDLVMAKVWQSKAGAKSSSLFLPGPFA